MQNSVPRDYTHTHTQQTTHTSILTIHHLIYSQLKQIKKTCLHFRYSHDQPTCVLGTFQLVLQRHIVTP